MKNEQYLRIAKLIKREEVDQEYRVQDNSQDKYRNDN